MTRKFIDISVALQADIASDPPTILPEIEYLDHHDIADEVLSFFSMSHN